MTDPHPTSSPWLGLFLLAAIFGFYIVASLAQDARAQEEDEAVPCVCPEPEPCPPEGYELFAIPEADPSPPEPGSVEEALQAIDAAQDMMKGGW
jgi:hypothetical protein